VASPIFDPKNRPTSPTHLGSLDVGRLQAKDPLVVSIDSAPGIFLHAAECVAKVQPCRLPRVPKDWKEKPPRVYVVPLEREVQVKNGNSTSRIDRLQETTDAVKEAFRFVGCEIVDGLPTRFDRRDVI
jgi:hypothetical protein